MFALALATTLNLALAGANDTVLVIDLQAVDISKERAAILNNRIAQGMAARGFEVITQADIRTAASLETQKALAGCDEASASCLAELAQGFGARYVVSGTVGMLDKDAVVLQLSMLDTSQGKIIARDDVQSSSLSKVADDIPAAIARLTAPLVGTSTTPPPATSEQPLTLQAVLFPAGAAVAGVGAVVVGVAAVFGLIADNNLGDPARSGADKQGDLAQAPLILTGLIAGGALIVAGGAAVTFAVVSE